MAEKGVKEQVLAMERLLVHTTKSRLFSAASGSLRLPPLLTKAAKSCSVNTTSK